MRLGRQAPGFAPSSTWTYPETILHVRQGESTGEIITATARNFYRPEPAATGSESGTLTIYEVALVVALLGPCGFYLLTYIWGWISRRRRALRRPFGPESLPVLYLDDLSLPDLVRYTLIAVLDKYEDKATGVLGKTRGRSGRVDPDYRARLRRQRMDHSRSPSGTRENSP